MNKDLQFGLQNEIEMKPLIEKTLNETFKMTEQFCCYDYVSDKSIVELKSRKCNYSQYPTTILTKHKVKKMMQVDKNRFVFIKFTDGLYYCRLNQELLDNSTVSKGGRSDRGRIEFNDYYYIPLNYFNKV